MDFVPNQKIRINATEELPTKYDNSEGWVLRQMKQHPEFWIVIPRDGNQVIFHQSQLSKIE